MAIADETTTENDLKRWMQQGVDFVQLRAKSLNAGDLLQMAKQWQQTLQGSSSRLLINARADVAMAAHAAGVHLTSRSGELTPAQIRSLIPGAFVSVSAHTLCDVERANKQAADLILFGPVFEKRIAGRIVVPGTGIAALAEACRAATKIPVLALGGITEENTEACLQAGAAGIAAIRLFATRQQ
ncbi:MAG: thiamine phosphate synthase [Acidobacteriaceae bacterium]|nr:thiamine phosphate synthase [Acidobacteriaceae bacterium]